MAIDTKDPQAAPAIAELVRRMGLEDRALLWARSMDAVRRFGEVLPGAERALLRDTRTSRATRRFLDDAGRCGAQAVSAHWDRVSEAFVADAHERGLKVYAMARNAESQASKLAAGLDGVVTNWPEEALAVRDERG